MNAFGKIDGMDWATRFAAFVEQKTTAAVTARIPGYVTRRSNGAKLGLRSITGAWASDRFDGPFFESEASNRFNVPELVGNARFGQHSGGGNVLPSRQFQFALRYRF